MYCDGEQLALMRGWFCVGVAEPACWLLTCCERGVAAVRYECAAVLWLQEVGIEQYRWYQEVCWMAEGAA